MDGRWFVVLRPHPRCSGDHMGCRVQTQVGHIQRKCPTCDTIAMAQVGYERFLNPLSENSERDTERLNDLPKVLQLIKQQFQATNRSFLRQHVLYFCEISYKTLTDMKSTYFLIWSSYITEDSHYLEMKQSNESVKFKRNYSWKLLGGKTT